MPDPPIRVQEPPVQVPGGRGRFWPKDQEMPTHWRRTPRRRVPCQKCRRLLLDNGDQAVVCSHTGRDLVYFRCRGCNHRFAMPVQE